MKICKVEIIKKSSDNKCINIYPVGYNSNKINIIAYDEKTLNRGNNVGYCIGLVSNDFSFTDKMTEINKGYADSFITNRAALIANEVLKAKFSSQRKQIITNAGIV